MYVRFAFQFLSFSWNFLCKTFPENNENLLSALILRKQFSEFDKIFARSLQILYYMDLMECINGVLIDINHHKYNLITAIFQDDVNDVLTKCVKNDNLDNIDNTCKSLVSSTY